MLDSARMELRSKSNELRRYFFLTTSSFRSKIFTRKFPVPQAGSKKRESMRSVSCFTKSSIAFTSRSAVKTSPCAATRSLDFICADSGFTFVLLTGPRICSNSLYIRHHTKKAWYRMHLRNRGSGKPIQHKHKRPTHRVRECLPYSRWIFENLPDFRFQE